MCRACRRAITPLIITRVTRCILFTVQLLRRRSMRAHFTTRDDVYYAGDAVMRRAAFAFDAA